MPDFVVIQDGLHQIFKFVQLLMCTIQAENCKKSNASLGFPSASCVRLLLLRTTCQGSFQCTGLILLLCVLRQANVTDVCVLYDTVDSVADGMAAKYYVSCPISPNSSNSSEAMGPVRMFDLECDTLQESTLHVTTGPGARSHTDSDHQVMNNGLSGPDLD